jgi:pSer/pThr/pTyr-binding forkhead associated (FHA) protein
MPFFRRRKAQAVQCIAPRLSIITGNAPVGDITGKVFSLIEGKNFIGRDADCEIVLHCSSVSHKHAVVTVSYDQARFSIADIKSRNGVVILPNARVNQKGQAINPGDRVQLGAIVLELQTGADAEETGTIAFNPKSLEINSGTDHGKK